MAKKLKRVVFEGDEFTQLLFLQACEENDIHKILKYLKGSFDINCHDENYQTGLYIAADSNYINLMHILLRVKDINVNACNHWGCTPLFVACARENANAVKLLIKHGADVNIPDKYGNSPLHNCVKLRLTDLINMLLDAGAVVDCENIYGKTPLYIAVLDSPNEYTAELLVTHGANVDLNNGKTMPILIDGALSCQNIRQLMTLEHFISLGCNVNIADILTRRTALHMVAISNYVHLAEILIVNGADYRVRDITGRTPMDIARRHQNKAIIHFLKYIIALENDNINDDKPDPDSLYVYSFVL